jgi:hypothetical protein
MVVACMWKISSGEQLLRRFNHAAELGNACALCRLFKFARSGWPQAKLSVNIERSFEINYVIHRYAPLLGVNAK